MRWPTSPPTLLVRTLTVTVTGVVLLLLVVFVVLSVNTQREVRHNVTAMLASTQHVVAELEALRQRQLLAQATILAESPTLKAAIDTFVRDPGEHDRLDDRERHALIETVRHELDKVAAHVDADVIVLVDPQQHPLAAVGPRAVDWPADGAGVTVHPSGTGKRDGVLLIGDRLYRTVWVDLTLQDAPVARLYVSTRLDDAYATAIAQLANAQIIIVTADRVVGSTLPAATARHFVTRQPAALQNQGTVTLADESFGFRRLVTVGDVALYALGSIDALSREETAAALRTLGLVALGAMLVAIAGSVWLAQTIARPIRTLSRSVEELANTGDLRGQLPASGSSRELDALTETFNHLLMSLWQAENATDEAYTGAIRALAAALDARDPYTAGHSERVSVLSVAIGEMLRLPAAELEVLRLGALLHDIGKIGVADAVLRKPGPLAPAEQAQIRQHPVLGARILRSVPFLAPHIPIVELHHERPDGQGYPYGLLADATPLAARIVHVADAYDAMTSARAYRAARSDAAAIAELRRCAGVEFDTDIVDALSRAHHRLSANVDRLDDRADGTGRVTSSLADCVGHGTHGNDSGHAGPGRHEARSFAAVLAVTRD